MGCGSDQWTKDWLDEQCRQGRTGLTVEERGGSDLRTGRQFRDGMFQGDGPEGCVQAVRTAMFCGGVLRFGEERAGCRPGVHAR